MNKTTIIRAALSVFTGLFIGIIAISLLEMVGHLIYTPPPVGDSASYKVYFDTAPLGAMLLVILAHAMGTFVGSIVAIKLNKGEKITGGIVGAFFAFATIADLTNMLLNNITPPIWFVIADPVSVLFIVFYLYKFTPIFLSKKLNENA